MNRIPDTGSNRSSVSEHSHQGFPVLLWGGKTKARIVDEMLRESGIGRTELIFDSTIDVLPFQAEATFTNDIQVLKKQIHKVSHYVVCMGGEHGYARFHAAKYLERAGLKPVTLIHHRSFVEPTSKVGTGCHIMPCAVVHKFADIGEQTIVNTSATIDHECLIGKGVHIMGNASLAGKVIVGDFATVGTNATILPFVQIGEGAFVGAGAVVTKDVPPYSVVAGVPARHLRTIEPEFSANLFEELLR